MTTQARTTCTCGGELCERYSPAHYREFDASPGAYNGQLTVATYFECQECQKKWMWPGQFGGSLFGDQVKGGKYRFFLSPDTTAKAAGRRPELPENELVVAAWLSL